MATTPKLLRPRICCNHSLQRSLSFLERFCKKETESGAGAGDSVSVSIKLDNAFKLYNLEQEPQSSVNLTKSTALKLYGQMQTIRRFETACASLYQEKTIRGFCHLYVGQEACCVGIHSAMRSQDSVITSYRSHGWTWVMGVSVHGIIAELCQKQSGCSRGKGGSMHTYAKGFYGGNGIVGAQVPMGTGIALAHAYRCDGGVNFACYGDGAANQGQIHEAFNIACLWKLPAIFVCENNKYGMGTSDKRSSCSTDYYTRGDYIPGIWVNGMDVLAVRSAAEFAINYALKCGPLVMELETYRYHGHSMSDPGTSYRKREEIQTMRQKYDPITTFRELCVKQGLATEEELKKVDDDIKNEVDNAVAQAKSDKETDLKELSTDVYAINLEKTIRGVTMRNLQHYNVGQSLVPLGTPKATPKSEIKEIPKEEAPKKDVKVVEDTKIAKTAGNIESNNKASTTKASDAKVAEKDSKSTGQKSPEESKKAGGNPKDPKKK